MRNRAALVLVFLAALATVPAVGGVGRFTSISPEGALFSSVVIDPSNSSTLYAATRAGVFKSSDSGDHWTLSVDPTVATEDPVVERVVGPMAIDPLRPSTLYAGMQTGEVLKTLDGGATWSYLDGIGKNGSILDLAVDPTGNGTVYALTAKYLLQSRDGGSTWNARREGLSDSDGFLSFAIDPGRPGIVYVGTLHALYVRGDGDQQWSLVFSGVNTVIDHIVVDPHDSQNVYASGYSDGGSFIVRSNDAGKTTKMVSVGYVRGLVIDPLSSAVYALTTLANVRCCEARSTIIVSSDRGATWTTFTTPFSDVTLLAIDPSRKDLFYWVDRGELFRREGPASLRLSQMGIAAAYTYDLVVDPHDPAALFAGTDYGVASSSDGGIHWRASALGFRATGLAISPQRPSALFAFNYGLSVKVDETIDIDEWKIDVTHVQGMGFDPSNPNIVYAALADGLAKSVDGGHRWTSIGTGQLPLSYYGLDGTAIVVDPTSPATVYATGGAGVFKSADAGTTWRTVLTDPLSLDSYYSYFRGLLIDPSSPSTIYVLANQKLYRSDDGGNFWRVILQATGQYFSRIAMDPLHPSSLYLIGGAGLSRSVDGGEHWEDFNRGLPTHALTAVTVDSLGNVYVATPRGVFVESPERPLNGAITYSVSLRTDAGNFISANHCGGSNLNANARTADRCETFTLYDLNGGTLNDGDLIQLQATNGGFVAAETGGTPGGDAPLNADRRDPASWETFVVHRAGGSDPIRSRDSITLQSSNGTYVAAESGGGNGCACDSRLNANRTVAREWETFVLLIH